MALALELPLSAQRSAGSEIRVRSAPYLLPPAHFASTINSVSLGVAVRDSAGAPVGGLTRGRFRVFDNGKAQVVDSFVVVASAPSPREAEDGPGPARGRAAPTPARARYIALLFDDMNSDRNALAEARKAAERFLHESLGRGDKMALFTTSSAQTLGFTSDKGALAAAVARIAPHPRSNSHGLGTCPRISPYQSYLIMEVHDPVATRAAEAEAILCKQGDEDPRVPLVNDLWSDADPVHMQAEATWEIARAAAQSTQAAIADVVAYTAKQPGERIVLFASGGFLSGGLEDKQDAIIADALKHEVVINALDAKGLYGDGPGRSLAEAPDAGTLPLPSFFFEETSKMSLHLHSRRPWLIWR